MEHKKTAKCIVCGKEFPFKTGKKYCGGRCHNKARDKKQKAYQQTPKYKARQRKYRQRPDVKDKKKKYLEVNKTKRKGIYFKKTLGLDYRDYLKMVEQQNNKCAICGKEETSKYNGKVKALAVDHNHTTEQIRDLLCGKCNLIVGQSKENIPLLQEIIKYLQKWAKK